MADDADTQDMADDADMQILNAAVTIRGELAELLVPADAAALGAALDELIATVRAAPPTEWPPHVDAIIDKLSGYEPTRKRLQKLCPTNDTDRGAADFWAPDQKLAGDGPEDNKLLSFVCQVCHYVNKLAFRPPVNNPRECQNPDVPRHLLKLP